MTELGHGSNVAALQTECVLDTTTDEWIVNTPDDSAIKWCAISTFVDSLGYWLCVSLHTGTLQRRELTQQYVMVSCLLCCVHDVGAQSENRASGALLTKHKLAHLSLCGTLMLFEYAAGSHYAHGHDTRFVATVQRLSGVLTVVHTGKIVIACTGGLETQQRMARWAPSLRA